MGTWVVRNVTLRMVAIILDKPHRQHERRYDGSPDDNAQEDEKLLGSARTSVTLCQVIGSLPSARTHFTHWGLPSSEERSNSRLPSLLKGPISAPPFLILHAGSATRTERSQPGPAKVREVSDAERTEQTQRFRATLLDRIDNRGISINRDAWKIIAMTCE